MAAQGRASRRAARSPGGRGGCAPRRRRRTRRGKKTDRGVPALTFDPAQRHPARGQRYGVGVVRWFIALVLDCHASLHGAARVLAFVGAETGQAAIAPDRSTGRLWLLRIGLAALLRPKVIADDWAWLVDHSIQIGQCKALVILGIRLSELPQGRPLCHRDMEPIALVP